jgi:hypothetical protein
MLLACMAIPGQQINDKGMMIDDDHISRHYFQYDEASKRTDYPPPSPNIICGNDEDDDEDDDDGNDEDDFNRLLVVGLVIVYIINTCSGSI